MIVENLPFHGPDRFAFLPIISYCSTLFPSSLLTLLNVFPLITSSFETFIWRQISSLLTSVSFLVQFDLTISRCSHFSSHEKLAVAFKTLLEHLRRPLIIVNHVLFCFVLVVQCLFGVLTTSSKSSWIRNF
ncbi:hypothetical protein P9112_005735 [Eukaryota sp. TZLM1-RC]